MRPRCLVIAGLALVLSNGMSDAGDKMPRPPSRPIPDVLIAKQDVFSRNRAFVLDADPPANRNTIYSADDRSTPLWSFPCQFNSDVREIFLADNGSTVAVIYESQLLRDKSGIEFHFRNRETIWFDYRVFMKPRKNPDKVTLVSVGVRTSCGGGGDDHVRWVNGTVDRGHELVITTTDDQRFWLDYESPRVQRQSQRIPTWVMVVGLVVAIGILAATLLIRRLSRSPTSVAMVLEDS